MQLAIPEHDCLVPGLGLYATHEAQNPLSGNTGADKLYDEQLSFHLEREDDYPELNLSPGTHFPIVVGQLRERIPVQLKKPSSMTAMLITMQHGCELLFLGFDTTESGGVHHLQLHVIMRDPQRGEDIIQMQPKTLHRYIRQN